MQENKYDNQIFFEKYSQMPRSKDGLKSAGEWSTLKKLLPDFQDKNVLDLGCGYGWHCLYAMENGANSAIGVDISEKMLKIAIEKNQFENLKYICSSIEEIDFPDNSFDIVVSSLAFHYIKSFDDIVKKVNKYLRANGNFIFSVEHPVFTSQGAQQWIKSETGEILHFPVDSYFYEGVRTSNFLGESVIKYHKTLTTYLNTLLENGFEIRKIVEPFPDEKMSKLPEMKDEMRRPMMLIVSAINHK